MKNLPGKVITCFSGTKLPHIISTTYYVVNHSRDKNHKVLFLTTETLLFGVGDGPIHKLSDDTEVLTAF